MKFRDNFIWILWVKDFTLELVGGVITANYNRCICFMTEVVDLIMWR